jgi:formylglycine-generating enzyme required for sulfatase activity
MINRRPISLILLVALLLSLLAPTSARVVLLAQDAAGPPIQGEIAYALDGDIWLHDLLTGDVQQLTDDGGNHWPAWSPDGRFLTYSHGDDLESSDLYLLDTANGETTLLVEQACCADWEPNGQRIAYLALGSDVLSVAAILPDGAGQETLLTELTVGGGAYPAGRLVWVDDRYLLAPLEYIDQQSLDFVRDVFPIDLYYAEADSGMRQDDCAVLGRDVVIDERGDLRSEAIAFERAGDECNTVMQAVSAPKGIDLVQYDDDKEGGELPWLAAPSFSSDGLYLVAERYTEADDPADAELWGVTVVNLTNNSQQDVAANATQPAWRPAPAIDPAAVHFAQAGERIVTMQPPLSLDGKVYQVSYFTTGDLKRRDAGLFHLATPQWLADQQVTGFVVSADGRVVRDAKTLRQVFELYHAAYHLYDDPSAISLPTVGDELDKVLDNPLFMAMEPEHFLRSRRIQTEHALRALLTDRRSDARLDPFFQEAFQTTPTRLEDGLAVFGEILQDQAAADAALGLLDAELAQAFDQANVAAQQGELGVKALRLMADLLYLSHLQRERGDWLTAYAQAFPRGEGSLDRDQLRAAANVLDEVDDAFQQRVDIAADFGVELFKDTLFKAGKELTVQAASKLAAAVAAQYGVKLAANAVASAASVVSVGLTVNGVLYGSDALVANFVLGRRSEELRQVFQAGRTALQEEAAGRSSDSPYDGGLAERFRSAHLLETLAATQAQRAYADGVAATFQLPNPLELLNWLRGKDWRAAVEGLHASADQVEAGLLDDLAAANATGATDLALGRVRPTLTMAGETFTEPVTGMTFVRVPAGEFIMGSSEEEIDDALALCNEFYDDCMRGWFEDEAPQHEVYLDEYWIGQTEVTNAQWQLFMEAGGYQNPDYWTEAGWKMIDSEDRSEPYCWDDSDLNQPDQPVVCISWYEALAFSRWLAEASGLAARLPTEAEWEKAARGTDGRIFPWGDEWDGSRLNYCDVNCPNDWKDNSVDDGYKYTAPIGSYPDGASPYGALDMAGNVWEWTGSQRMGYPYDAGDGREELESDGERVVRGGAWGIIPGDVRAAARPAVPPANRNDNNGVRVVVGAGVHDFHPAGACAIRNRLRVRPGWPQQASILRRSRLAQRGLKAGAASSWPSLASMS